MKTTIEVSDALYRRAKSEAALRGRKVRDLVEEGLRLANLMKGARGTVDSGVTDLASNPKHLKDFGRNAPRHP